MTKKCTLLDCDSVASHKAVYFAVEAGKLIHVCLHAIFKLIENDVFCVIFGTFSGPFTNNPHTFSFKPHSVCTIPNLLPARKRDLKVVELFDFMCIL